MAPGWFSLGSVVGLLLFTLPVAAEQASDATRKADALFEQAKELLREGAWPRACERFEQSFALDPSPSTQVKIARCREHEGRLTEAEKAYGAARTLNRELSRDATRADELEAVIRAELAALEAAFPKLLIEIRASKPGEVALSIDSREIPASAVGRPVRVDPGEHDVVARAPGHRDARLRVVLARGETRSVSLELLPAVDATTASASGPLALSARSFVPPRKRPAERDGLRTVGSITFGAGVATLGVAGYFGWRTLALVREARRDCSTATDTCGPTGLARLEEARGAQRTGLILAGGAAALLGTGAVLYLTHPKTDTSLGAGATHDAAWCTLQGRF